MAIARKGQKGATLTAIRSPGRDFVQSLERGLAVIKCLGAEPRQSLAHIARSTGITRAAARRFLITLEKLGYVGRSGADFYLLPRTLELGYSYLSTQSLPQIVQPHLESLARDLNETSSVTVFDQHRILYIARVTTNRLVGSTLAVGSTLPAYCTGSGRVLLGALPEQQLADYLRATKLQRYTPQTIINRAALVKELQKAARQGWYLSDEEIDEGVRSLAMPLHDANGNVIAAINISCYAGRVPTDTLIQTYLPRIRNAAQAIDRELKACRHLSAEVRT